MLDHAHEPDDGALARAIAASRPGEARALEAELYRRFAPRARLFAQRLLRDPDAAGDLAQHALMLTIEKLRAGGVETPERIGPFILGICRGLAANQTRSHARHRVLAERFAAEVTTPAVDPAPQLEGTHLDRLAECMQKLTERSRTVTVLTFYAERSSTEIARELRLTPTNVRVIRHRAIAALQDCMGARQ